MVHGLAGGGRGGRDGVAGHGAGGRHGGQPGGGLLGRGALGAGATIGFLAIIREQTNDAGSDVLAILEYGSPTPTNGGAFTTQFAAAGALRAA